jgi:ribosomal protein L36
MDRCEGIEKDCWVAVFHAGGAKDNKNCRLMKAASLVLVICSSPPSWQARETQKIGLPICQPNPRRIAPSPLFFRRGVLLET